VKALVELQGRGDEASEHCEHGQQPHDSPDPARRVPHRHLAEQLDLGRPDDEPLADGERRLLPDGLEVDEGGVQRLDPDDLVEDPQLEVGRADARIVDADVAGGAPDDDARPGQVQDLVGAVGLAQADLQSGPLASER
jgi:hypothetical protein